LDQVRQFQSYFDRVVFTKIPREENTRADELSKIASGTYEEIEATHRQIIVLTEPSITPKVNIMEADTVPNEPEWATEIIQFLKSGLLPQEKTAARKVKSQTNRFCLLRETLYKRGYSEPLLKCLSKIEAEYVLKEIHEGVCGNHSGGRMLAQKTIHAGYYWPTVIKDSARLVKRCDKCQRFSRIMKIAPEKLTPITSPWPFAKWGVDIVCPMLVGKGSRKFLVVAVDYFTKWAEAEALAAITTTNITSFLWRSVVCRFGIPHEFVTDNGKQFDCEPFQRWCSELRIRN